MFYTQPNDNIITLDAEPLQNNIQKLATKHTIPTIASDAQIDAKQYQDLFVTKRQIKISTEIQNAVDKKEGKLNTISKQGKEILKKLTDATKISMTNIEGLGLTPMDIGFNSFFAFSLYYLRVIGKDIQKFNQLTKGLNNTIISQLKEYGANSTININSQDIATFLSNAEGMSKDIKEFVLDSNNSIDYAGFIATLASILQIGFTFAGGTATNESSGKKNQNARDILSLLNPQQKVIATQPLKGQIVDIEDTPDSFTAKNLLSSCIEMPLMTFLSPKMARNLRNTFLEPSGGSMQAKLQDNLKVDDLNNRCMMPFAGIALCVSGLSDSIPTHDNYIFNTLMKGSFIAFAMSNSIKLNTDANVAKTVKYLDTIAKIPNYILLGQAIPEKDLLPLKDLFPKEYKAIDDAIQNGLLKVIPITKIEKEQYQTEKNQINIAGITQSGLQSIYTALRILSIASPDSMPLSVHLAMAGLSGGVPVSASVSSYLSLPKEERNIGLFVANLLRCTISPISGAAAFAAVQSGFAGPENAKAVYRMALWTGMASTSILFGIGEKCRANGEQNAIIGEITQTIMAEKLGLKEQDFAQNKNKYSGVSAAISDTLSCMMADVSWRNMMLELSKDNNEEINFGNTPQSNAEALSKLKEQSKKQDIILQIFTKQPTKVADKINDAIKNPDLIETLDNQELKCLLLKKYNNVFMKQLRHHGIESLSEQSQFMQHQ